MSDFRKLTKMTWRYYLLTGLLVLGSVCANAFYQLQDAGIFLPLPKEIRDINLYEQLEVQMGIEGVYYTVINYFSLVVLIALLMAVSNFIYTEKRTNEFMLTIPVKKSARILQDYLVMMGIFLLGMVSYTGILTAGQDWYTGRIYQGEVLQENIATANHRMICYSVLLFLFLAVAYTWIYLFMLLCKNRIAGIVLGTISVLFFTGEDFWHEIEEIVWRFNFALDNSTFYELGNGFVPSLTIKKAYYSANLELWEMLSLITPMLITLLVLFIGILLVAHHQEESKGRVFYFTWMDIVFAVSCGLVFILEANTGLIGFAEELDLYSLVLIGLCIAVGIYLLIHPLKKVHKNDWEVK